MYEGDVTHALQHFDTTGPRSRSTRRTCTRLLAFRENLKICARKDRGGFSLLQIRAAIMRGMRPNALFSVLPAVTSPTLSSTCWAERGGFELSVQFFRASCST